MPQYLLKPDPDEDFYVEWYTVSECVSWCGTRSEAATLGYTPELLQRADETGTTARNADWFGYRDERMMLAQRWWLPRRNLADYARLWAAEVTEDDPRMQGLLEALDAEEDKS